MSNDSTSTLATALIVVAVVGLMLAFLCVGGGFFVGVGAPFMTASSASRGEVATNVDGIRTAVIAYEAAFGELVPTLPAPRPVSELDKAAVAWTSPDDFNQLGWAPDGLVRGTYWVSVSAGGGFEVHGMIDADGDGIPAHWRATRAQGHVEQLTPDHIL